MHEQALLWLRVTEITSGNETLFISDAMAEFGGQRVICSGTGSRHSVAYARMISEVAERSAFLRYRRRFPYSCGLCPAAISSTGFAAHTTATAARGRATLELVERSFNDLLRRRPAYLPDQIVHEEMGQSWIYFIKEYGLFHAVSRKVASNTSGWGAGAAMSIQGALRKARDEALMMAASLRDYGRRGNAITVLAGGADLLGTNIAFEDYGMWQVLGETRHVVRAYWSSR